MSRNREAEPIVNLVCSVVFCLFTFCYLLFFQNDMLAYAQHYLSGGTTVYNSLVGAVIITLLLMLFSLLSAKVLLRNFFVLPALYHLPSALLLAAMTDINIVEAGTSVFGWSWVVALVIFCIALLLNQGVSGMAFLAEPRNTQGILRGLWINLVVIVSLLLLAVFSGNTNEYDHVRLRAERMIRSKKYASAVELINKSDVNSPQLTMIKAFALAKQGALGDDFFERPVVRGAENLLPSVSNQLVMTDSYAIYQALGGVPAADVNSREYLKLMKKRGMIKPAGKEYLYTSFLLDRDIDGFVNNFKDDYDSTTVVKKHYREALTLYRHLHSTPVIDFHVPELEADFADFQAMIKKYPDTTIRENAIRDVYGNTYWFYYYFTASRAFTQSVSREN